MVSVIIVIAFIALLALYLYKFSSNRPNGFPPGPPKIPLFGSYLFLLLANPCYLHKGALFFSKLYKSKIIGLFIGPFPTVVVNDAQTVKEILNRKEFDGRPDIFLGRLRDINYNRKGIFFQDGPLWKDQRRFILRYLRDYGFGRRFQELEHVMTEELQDMIDLIKNGPKYPHDELIFRKGQALCPYFMGPFTTNSFLHVMCGERIPREEQAVLIELVKEGTIFQRTGDDYGRMLSFIPWIRYIFPTTSGYKPLRKSSMYIRDFMKRIVHKNIETYEDGNVRHFLDLYIAEMKKAEKDGDEFSYFETDQFYLSMVDFSFPAITAIPIQLSLLLQWFLLRPDLLKRCQNEVDDVVGHGRLPNLDDRNKMPFTEATVRECLRRETLVPSDIPHKTMVDTELKGFKIPKDTIVIPSLYALHNDKEMWNDPNEFRPERFLDENGNLSLNKDLSLPFGAGKRLCAGETFARNFLFLLAASLCQHFDITLRKGDKLPEVDKNPCGIVVTPPDFWVNLTPR